jgi:hypothetical protein
MDDRVRRGAVAERAVGEELGLAGARVGGRREGQEGGDHDPDATHV